MTKNEADDWAEAFNAHADEDAQARNQVADMVRANNWLVDGVGDKPPPLNPDGSLAGEPEPDKSHLRNADVGVDVADGTDDSASYWRDVGGSD